MEQTTDDPWRRLTEKLDLVHDLVRELAVRSGVPSVQQPEPIRIGRNAKHLELYRELAKQDRLLTAVGCEHSTWVTAFSAATARTALDRRNAIYIWAKRRLENQIESRIEDPDGPGEPFRVRVRLVRGGKP